MVVFQISWQPASDALGLHFECLQLLRLLFFFKGVRWLVSKLLLRVGAIARGRCEAGMGRMALESKASVDAEGLWRSQHTHLIRNCRDASAALLSQRVTAEMLIC